MPSPVFLLGVPRSGTTLFRVMLAGHPQLWSPPEMVLATSRTMAERKRLLEERFWERGGLRRALMDLCQVTVEEAKAIEEGLETKTIPEVYAWIQERLGGRILVDKCPHLAASEVGRAANGEEDTGPLENIRQWFPEATYLYIVRHPGSVIRSLENMPMAEVMLQGYGGDARKIWYEGNRLLEAFLATIPEERRIRIRYEDLVADPKGVMEKVCATIGVPFHEAVINPYEGDRMREGPKGARAVGDPNMAGRGKIQPELATEWLASFDLRVLDESARGLATRLGYDLSQLGPPPVRAVGERLGSLLDTVRRIEAGIEIPMDIDAIEGRRFLLRMLSASIATFVEEGDTERPVFHHSEGPSRKMFADCPDADYRRASIRTADGEQYLVRGLIPAGSTHVSVLLYGKGGRVARHLHDEQLQPDADGNFAVGIGKIAPDQGVWLQADGDETAVIVRQYFVDRTAQPSLAISVVKLGEIAPPTPLSAEVLVDGIARAERMVEAVFRRTVRAWKMASVAALNRFMPIGGDDLFPTPDNRYRMAWYRFGRDQVMFVRGRLPKARYHGFTLYNAWMESLDYTTRRICLNHAQIQADADGRFELCLAHRDPGHPNWLDTSGHLAGYILERSLLPEGPSSQDGAEPLEIQVMYEKEWKAKAG